MQAKTVDFTRARGPAERILADFISFQLRLKKPCRDFVRVLMAQLYTRGSELAPCFAALQEHINPPLVELFRSLMARRQIRQDVNLAILIEIFKLLHIRIITLWINEEPPGARAMQLLDEEMKLFCHRLAGKADPQITQIEWRRFYIAILRLRICAVVARVSPPTSWFPNFQSRVGTPAQQPSHFRLSTSCCMR